MQLLCGDVQRRFVMAPGPLHSQQVAMARREKRFLAHVVQEFVDCCLFLWGREGAGGGRLKVTLMLIGLFGAMVYSAQSMAFVFRPKIVILVGSEDFSEIAQSVHFRPTQSIRIPGVFTPIVCDKRGVCLTEPGPGSINCAISLTRMVAQPLFANTLFLRAGIAGGPPRQHEALGSAYWANYVVSWSFGHHLYNHQGPFYVPFRDLHLGKNVAVLKLYPPLVQLAYRMTHTLKLPARKTTWQWQERYGVKATPAVEIGATISSGDFWSGSKLSKIADDIVARDTHGHAVYATTAFQDIGDASALYAAGILSHYLSLRTVSDYDQPPPGMSIQKLFFPHYYYPAGGLAIRNLARVTGRFVHEALIHWPRIAKLMKQGQKRIPYPTPMSHGDMGVN